MVDESNEYSLITPEEAEGIRKIWYQERWFYSIVDIVNVLAETDNPNRYWSDLKRKLLAEGLQPYDFFVRLKMEASDGKRRLFLIRQRNNSAGSISLRYEAT